MESNNEKINSLNKHSLNEHNVEEQSEIILIDDKNNYNLLIDLKMENEDEEGELISDEEYMIDCCRYGDLEDLKNLFLENSNIEINYTDGRKNNALRI